MNWVTFHFRDVVQHRTGGASPFGNRGVSYRGSPDDAALNAAVQTLPPWLALRRTPT
jgi:hypothetical protein